MILNLPTCIDGVNEPTAGVWYRVVGTGEPMAASISSRDNYEITGTADFDTMISVYEEDVDGNDNYSTELWHCGVGSVVAWNSELDKEYWIRVSGYTPSDGFGIATSGEFFTIVAPADLSVTSIGKGGKGSSDDGYYSKRSCDGDESSSSSSDEDDGKDNGDADDGGSRCLRSSKNNNKKTSTKWANIDRTRRTRRRNKGNY